MVQLSKAVYCFLLAALPIPTFAAANDEVTSGLNDIAARVKALSTMLNALPNDGTSMDDAANVFAGAYALSVAMDTIASGIQDESVAQLAPDALTVLSSLGTIVPNAVTAMSTIVAKPQVFAQIASSQRFILVALNALSKSSTDLETAIISKLPFFLVPPAQALRVTVDTGFQTVLAAFSA